MVSPRNENGWWLEPHPTLGPRESMGELVVRKEVVEVTWKRVKKERMD